MKEARTIAERMTARRNAKKAGWALEFEAEYFDGCRADLLNSLEAAGKAMVDELVKARLRVLNRAVKGAAYVEALVACFEAAVLITWEGRARGWERNYICNFASFNTLTDDATEGHDLFDLGYMTVRKAYY